jgi:hypothetical protein
VGCLPTASSQTSSQPDACTAGYSSQSPVINLSRVDDGRSITAPLCAAVWVVLAGSQPVEWQFVQSSDVTVLSVVPLPLPHPTGGGTEAVYLAKHTGTAVLSADAVSLPCVPTANCPTPAHWQVTITVTP